MSLGMVVATAAMAAGTLAALAQVVRPRLGLLPLCFGALGALVLEGTAEALGHAGGLLALASLGRGPDAKAVALSTGLHLAALGPALMRTGIALGVVTLLTALAWWRAQGEAPPPGDDASPDAPSGAAD